MSEKKKMANGKTVLGGRRFSPHHERCDQRHRGDSYRGQPCHANGGLAAALTGLLEPSPAWMMWCRPRSGLAAAQPS